MNMRNLYLLEQEIFFVLIEARAADAVRLCQLTCGSQNDILIIVKMRP